jgi:proline iminopeptidase
VALIVLTGLTAMAVGVPAAAQSRQGLLSLPDARIFYEVVGEGPPIVVVHGGPGLDHNYLRPGMDVLAARHTLVYYDQRGTGRSDAALDSTGINLDAFVGDIEALRQALGYDRITVLGHSFGGLIALAYARTHPESTEALILMDTVEPGSRWKTLAARRAASARTPADSAELAELTASEGYAARDPATMSAVYKVAFRSTLRVPERVSELNLDLSGRTARNGPEVARLLGGELKDVNWWDALPEMDVPTLVVHGRYDPIPPAMARALAEALPLGQLVLLPTGHFPYIEDPGGLVEAVSAFLAGLQR